ncbi:transmembrane protein 121-like [Gracilinanus agilis]|uniref:transmembrane protein 121-like n=1 Tax=Gracilinanus agilis TaxID=191870 RepID=UPI001CFC6E3E|nr:transmembrane protein 121-like [Gracilinanus agilis]
MVSPCPTWLVVALISGSMLLADGYLMGQSPGGWWLGLGLLLSAGNVCLLLVLRPVVAGAGAEAHTTRRGCTMLLWFLYIFVLEMKVYFIYRSCRAEGHCPGPPARQAFTLVLALSVPGLFALLGSPKAPEILSSFQWREELRSHLLWVVADLLDILDVQAGLWEPPQRALPFWAEGVTFFYCYALLLLLPCAALGELSLQGLQPLPHRMVLYPLLSLLTVNLATSLIRATHLLLFRDTYVSSIFLGKNLLALVLKLCMFLQYRKQWLSGSSSPRTPTQPGRITPTQAMRPT